MQFFNELKIRREPIFTLAFEGALFRFHKKRPALAPLLKLPPKIGARMHKETHII